MAPDLMIRLTGKLFVAHCQAARVSNEPEQYTLESCTRRKAESIERRFCFDLTVKEKQGTMTFQALSDEDRRLWLDAMDGKEPIYQQPPAKAKTDDTLLDDIGFNFMKKGIGAIEGRGLQEQGLYRVVGVNSKVTNLLKTALDPKKGDKVNYDDASVWETKTITSAIKHYLRNLPEPLMTFKHHEQFIKAAKQESKTLRILDVHKLCHMLPKANFEMLDLLIGHLKRVSDKCEENKMSVANLGVCFGPTLMRPEEETVAAIMDIKFCNIIVELLVNNYDKIFKTQPDEAEVGDSKTTSQSETADGTVTSRISLFGNRARPTSTPAEGRDGSSPWGPSSRIYANQAPVHPSRATGRPQPISMYNQTAGGKQSVGSTNSSTESLNSSTSKPGFSPRTGPTPPSSASSYGGGASSAAQDWPRRQSNDMPTYGNVSALASRFMANSGDSPAFGSVKKRSSNDYSGATMNSSTQSTGSLTSSHGSVSSSGSKTPRRTVITRYPCKAEHESELSFEANQMIHNVKPSHEPGWLEGELNGKVGLIPSNYVEFLDS